MQTTQIKENTCVHQGFGFGLINPSREIILPNRPRLTPLIISSHDITGAIHIATGIQAIADKTREITEILTVCRFIVLIRQNHGIVLI